MMHTLIPIAYHHASTGANFLVELQHSIIRGVGWGLGSRLAHAMPIMLVLAIVAVVFVAGWALFSRRW